MHNTITSGEIAAFLHATAAAFETMPAGEIPTGSLSLAVTLYLHRHENDGTTNQTVMSFADAISTATATPAPDLHGGTYGTPRPAVKGPINFDVVAFLKTSKPVIEIDPNL